MSEKFNEVQDSWFRHLISESVADDLLYHNNLKEKYGGSHWGDIPSEWEHLGRAPTPDEIIITGTTFHEGEGPVQIGDMTWDYDNSSMTVTYTVDDHPHAYYHTVDDFGELIQALAEHAQTMLDERNNQ